MTRFLEWALGLERIRLTGGPVSLDLSNAPPPWMMLLGVVLVLILVDVMYRLERGSRRLRMSLATVRALFLLAVLGMVARPNLVLRRDRVDPSVVAVLVDRSGSMGIADKAGAASAPSSSASGVEEDATRYGQALAALTANDGRVMKQLGGRHRVELWGFSDHAERVDRAATESAIETLRAERPQALTTDLVASLDDVLSQTRGVRLAAVVVLSDGRQSRPVATEHVVEEARERQTPIHAVAVGSPRPRRDLAVEHLRADEDVFRRDIVSVVARVVASGFDGPVNARLRMMDQASGKMLDTREVRMLSNDREQAGGAKSGETATEAPWTEVEFRFRPEAAGRFTLRVEAEPQPDEFDYDNNNAQVVIHVHDEKLRVLYVEGPPRFEYRFLKNTLLRETTVGSSCLLLDATEAFVQEGSEPIRAFPVSPGELNHYDVVLLGDVDPRGDWISPAQIAMIVDFVGARGGGLGFLAGERAMPHHLRGTALEKLLPVRIDPSFTGRYRELLANPFAIQPTPEGRRHPLLRFEVDPGENDATLAALPGWYWYARVLGPRAGAEVLAVHAEEGGSNGPVPVLAAGRFGAGRTLFVGSDDVWRWRRGDGEAFYDTFWLNCMRYLAGERRAGAARPWRLETDRRTYQVSDRVGLRLTAKNPAVAAGLGSVTVRVQDGRGAPAGEATLERPSLDAAIFEGTFRPDHGGAMTATALTPADSSERPSRSFVVTAFDPERRRPEADPAFLRGLCEATGGQCVSLKDLGALAASIPDRGSRVPDDIVEPLWDTKLALAATMLLLVTEWTARKLKGLA